MTAFHKSIREWNSTLSVFACLAVFGLGPCETSAQATPSEVEYQVPSSIMVQLDEPKATPSEFEVECEVAYRPDDYTGFTDSKKLSVEVTQRRSVPTITDKVTLGGEFEVRLSGSSDAWIGNSVSVSVIHNSSKESLYHVVYQTIRNLDNNHGMTGLHYVNSPTSDAWINLFCHAK